MINSRIFLFLAILKEEFLKIFNFFTRMSFVCKTLLFRYNETYEIVHIDVMQSVTFQYFLPFYRQNP